MNNKMRPAIVRLLEKVELDARSGCWLWTGAMRPNGYGQMFYAGRPAKAHRVSFELHNGAIPTGLDVCHKCDNRRCVNPAHLFLGTRLDNMRDCAAKGRLSRGEQHGVRIRGELQGLSRLRSADVVEIRQLGMHESKAVLARRFGVSETTIGDVLRRRTWKHIVDEVQSCA